MTSMHHDFPAVIGFALLLALAILAGTGLLGIAPEQFEMFVAGAFTFEVTAGRPLYTNLPQPER